MGCGISKSGIADDKGTCRVFPHRRKLDNLHTNGRIIAYGTPFTKEGGEDDDIVDSQNGCKNISSSRKSVEILKMDACQEEKERKVDRKDVKSNNVEILLAKRDGNKDNHEECKDKVRISDFNGSLRIGSPSFREYCIVDCHSEDGFKDDGGSDGKNKETKGKEAKCNAPPKSNEGSMNKSRQKRLRKVLPTERPSLIKNPFDLNYVIEWKTILSLSFLPLLFFTQILFDFSSDDKIVHHLEFF
ncbi:uncharacterized protein LOC130777099 [Actinidia eriantha]|uniref:uncharacterized protein LOC130777099 n=1 Tax=Actinidia eriantha TaxID=165200 RepID=UPI002585BE28|nr:uncharacterized protein LOC130777099 [Actinidia eriantha]